MKKSTKKVNKPSYTVNLDEIETLEDIPVVWGLAKQEAGLAMSDAELLAICKRVLDECGTTVIVVECKCECKKLPWYKRFWNWIRRK